MFLCFHVRKLHQNICCLVFSPFSTHNVLLPPPPPPISLNLEKQCVCQWVYQMAYVLGLCWTGIVSFLDSCALDEMGKRVDELEKNISDLMHQVESREDPSSNKWNFCCKLQFTCAHSWLYSICCTSHSNCELLLYILVILLLWHHPYRHWHYIMIVKDI